MIAFITGGTGFIGSHLIGKLLSEGWDVHLLCRKETNFSLVNNSTSQPTIHELTGKPEDLNRIVKKVKPDLVFHLASLSPSVHTLEDIPTLIESNITLGTQLVEAMVQNECYQLINTGTILQHYEGMPYSPASLYGATKQAFEAIIQYYIETTPLKAIHLKLANVYGKNDPRPRIFSLLKKAALEQITLEMTPGEQYIDLIYIDDVVEAFYVAALRFEKRMDRKQEKFLISSQTPIKLKELVRIYEEVAGHKVSICWGGKPYRSREMMAYQPYGIPLPQWKIKNSLYEGIKKTLSIE
ncbi:MAG TPA: NAD-dependent dehydratase [Paenibacillaceae bacterium]|nr:NAD-dependent dehydratase [Paenibacillaceae bacterium]